MILKNLPQLLHEYRTGIANPSLKNYQNTLKTGIEILKICSTEDEGLPVLKHIFTNHMDFNDLCSKIETYLCTNVGFKYYRYTRTDNQYKERFDLDFSKHDCRSLLILIRCNYIGQNSISRTSGELIEAFEHIDQVKRKTSLETLKKDLPNIDAKYIENRYKDKKYKISRSGELAKMINANLYLLSYNHDLFTQSKKHGRTFNAFTSLNRVYRENELAFQLAEHDIKSANPQIIDKMFGFNNWKNVYSNLMQAYEINRGEAKIMFNATLNNYRLSKAEATEIYLNSGYNTAEAKKLASFTAQSNKGDVYREMAKHEGDIMQKFIDSNFKNTPCIRLHDAVYFEPEFYSVKNANETGIDFGFELLDKELLNLDFKVNTYKTILTTPPTRKFKTKAEYGEKGQLQYKGEHFCFYDHDFLQLNATFNIADPIVNNGTYRTPTPMEFIERLEKLFKILYYLNEDFTPFFNCVEHIHEQEGISFNKNYVYTIASKWNFDINDALEFVKNRNWTYKGDAIKMKVFNKKYHIERNEYINTIGRKALKDDLKKLYIAIQQNQLHHIDKNDYHNARRHQTGEIIDQVYNLIGIKKRNTIDVFNKVVHKIDDLYSNYNIGRQITAPPPSIRQISKDLQINRRLAKKIKEFHNNKQTILSKLHNAIQNVEHLEDVGQLFAHPQQDTAQDEDQNNVAAQDAFDYEIDYNGGYFDVPLSNAIERTKLYYVEWCKHQTIKQIMQGAKGGITQNYDNHIWRKEQIASNIFDNHRVEIIANLRTA